MRSGGLAGGEDDVVAEGFELAFVAAGLAAAVGVPGVVVRAEVAVAGGGVLQQVPDGDQDGAADGDVRLVPSAAGAAADAAVPFAQERIGAGGAVAGLAGVAAGVAVAVAFLTKK